MSTICRHDKAMGVGRHIYGLDAVRFVAALWVFFSHGGVPQIEEFVDKSVPLGMVIAGVYNNLWSGPAAVIVFFVVSGFVIHYPYTDNKPINLVQFFIRRYIRICIPLLIILLIVRELGLSMNLLDAVTWSLYAELIYYSLYPLIRNFSCWWVSSKCSGCHLERH